MSIKVMSWIWEHATVGGSELLILLAMADFADDNGGSIYPSMQTLAKKARMSTDQARRVVHKLIADGHVELVQEGGWDGGRNRSNEYRLTITRTCKPQVPRTRKLQAPGADASTGTSADASTVLAQMQDDPSYNHPIDPPLIHDERKLPVDPVYARLQDEWMNVGLGQLEQHKALADKYGFENWLRGFNACKRSARASASYVEKVVISKMPDKPPAKKQADPNSRYYITDPVTGERKEVAV